MAAEYPGLQNETDPVAEADLAAHVAAADPHTQYQKESEKAANNGYASLDGGGQVPLSQLGNAPTGGGGAPDASATVKGISKLSVAPASGTNPIAVGDNDPRNSDTRTPTDASVTDAKIATTLSQSKITNLAADLAAKQPLDADLTALAALSTTAFGRALLELADAAAGRTALAAAPLASPALTGTPTVPTAAQGTNTTQAASTAYVQTEAGLLIPKSLVDAKGDLLVGTADNTVGRLAVGTNGQVLTADSAQASGVKWAAAGGGSSTVQVGRVSKAAATNLANSVQMSLTWDTEAEDTDAMVNLTDTVALTGTVAKTSGLTTLTGSGTSFTSQVTPGQNIVVPGGASETRRVVSIASDTSLTVETAFSNSASGQTATRLLDDRITAATAGVFLSQLTLLWSGNATGYREVIPYIGSGTAFRGSILDADDRPPVGSSAFWMNVTFRPVRLAVGDFVRFEVWHNAGASLTIATNSSKAALLRLGA